MSVTRLLTRAGRAGRGLVLLTAAALLGACAVPLSTADRHLSDMPVTTAKPRPALSLPALAAAFAAFLASTRVTASLSSLLETSSFFA